MIITSLKTVGIWEKEFKVKLDYDVIQGKCPVSGETFYLHYEN